MLPGKSHVALACAGVAISLAGIAPAHAWDRTRAVVSCLSGERFGRRSESDDLRSDGQDGTYDAPGSR